MLKKCLFSLCPTSQRALSRNVNYLKDTEDVLSRMFSTDPKRCKVVPLPVIPSLTQNSMESL